MFADLGVDSLAFAVVGGVPCVFLDAVLCFCWLVILLYAFFLNFNPVTFFHMTTCKVKQIGYFN